MFEQAIQKLAIKCECIALFERYIIKFSYVVAFRYIFK